MCVCVSRVVSGAYNAHRQATRLCLSLMGVNPNDGSEFPLGWVNLNLVDYNGNLRMGVTSLNLWPGEKANPIGTLPPPLTAVTTPLAADDHNFVSTQGLACRTTSRRIRSS